MQTIKELEKKVSEDRIIKDKKGHYICKFCKEHPDDCFCNDDAKLQINALKDVLESIMDDESIPDLVKTTLKQKIQG